jgi:hypothetical protein
MLDKNKKLKNEKVQKKLEMKIKEDAKTYEDFEDFSSIQNYLLSHTQRGSEIMIDFNTREMVRVYNNTI